MNTEFKVTSNLQGLARRLVAEDILDAAAVERAIAESSKKNKTLLAWLLKSNAAAGQLAAAAAEEYGIPLIDIRAFDLSQAPLSLVSETLIDKHQVLPLHLRGNQLFIAMRDPTDHEVIDEIAFSSGFHIEPVLVSADQVAPAIERAMEATNPAFDEFDQEEGLEGVDFQVDAESLEDATGDPAVDETPVVRFINKVRLHKQSCWIQR